MKPKALVIRTAGTNCDKETAFAFSLAGAKAEIKHIRYLKEHKKEILRYQMLVIPGGFSYGDDLGAGKIFSLELMQWFRESLEEFKGRGGLILGICNGFQVLVKSGILPFFDFRQQVSLIENTSAKFEDRWVYLMVENKINNIWLKKLPSLIMLPVAHGEGKLYASGKTLSAIKKNNLAVLKYSLPNGKTTLEYPFNPNGSFLSIAGLSDKDGKVLGLMPHPERNIFPHHNPFWKAKEMHPDGLNIFKNGVDYFI